MKKYDMRGCQVGAVGDGASLNGNTFVNVGGGNVSEALVKVAESADESQLSTGERAILLKAADIAKRLGH